MRTFATAQGDEQDVPVHPGRRPFVLAITSEIPWPLNTGGHLRTFHLLRALAEEFRVRLVAPAGKDQSQAIEALRASGIATVTAPAGPRAAWREALRAANAAVRREPYVMYRRHDRRATWAVLRSEASRLTPDVFYLDHLDSWVYRRALPGVPAVVDLHNVYSTLAGRAAAEQPRRWIRPYLRAEACLLGRVERRVARSADALLTVSEEDRRHFAALARCPSYLVPNGVDCGIFADLPAGRRSQEPILLYVGALSWGPNVAAARVLATEILSEVRRRIPGTRVRIVGRDPGPEVMALGDLDGVEVLGSVPEVLPHLRAAAALVVPLESGGGTRLKILEAFAAGLPVVSTPVGCEGIDVVESEHLLIASRGRLADAVIGLLGDPALGERLAERSRILAGERYDWRVVGEAACNAVRDMIPA